MLRSDSRLVSYTNKYGSRSEHLLGDILEKGMYSLHIY